MIVWENIYSVGVALIDEQHKKFIGIINDLYGAIERKSLKEDLDKIFKGLSEYALYHFATEEKYFDDFKYEEAEGHKKKHEEFRQIIKDYQEKLSQGNFDLTLNLVDFLEDWLADHVVTMDKKYTQCFRNHGLK